jgi:hypothetical protein
MLSPLCVRLIASANVADISIVSNFGQTIFFSSCGIVFVTTSLVRHELLMTSTALPDKTIE